MWVGCAHEGCCYYLAHAFVGGGMYMQPALSAEGIRRTGWVTASERTGWLGREKGAKARLYAALIAAIVQGPAHKKQKHGLLMTNGGAAKKGGVVLDTWFGI
ncbi:hypothetical protein H4S00_006414 [Coemansia sp. D1744]|nr:hypothetical protein H4S00_006414 [Coemansia sp. D1744]